jgi:hypothetical protein
MYETVSLNGMAVRSWVSDISEDAETGLSEIFNKRVYQSLIVDESKDNTSTEQMRIFVHCLTSDFQVFEELFDIHSIQGQTQGSRTIQPILCSFGNVIWI